jgi:NADH:ubiquinone oxidoreductase subunit 6 (subunit J)
MAKLIGYILALIGIAAIAIVMVPEIGGAVNLPEPLSGTPLLVSGVILAIIGIMLIVRSGREKQPVEVPIFKGKQVVGYRRHK